MAARALATELEKLVNLAVPLSPFVLGWSATTDSTRTARDCFGKIVANSHSVLALMSDNIEGKGVDIDASGIASLTRDLIEAYDIFFYLCLERVPKQVRAFRTELYTHHHARELYKINSALAGSSPSDDIFVRFGEQRLKEDPIFQSLSPRQQKSLLSGRSATFQTYGSRPADYPVPEPHASGVYKLLSNAVHATSLGIMGTVIYNGHAHPFISKFVFIAVDTAVQYLAHALTAYLRVRPKLRTRLSPEDIDLIRNFSKRDFVAILGKHWQR